MGKTIEGKAKHFRWSVPMERMFLEILADEASKGNKPSATFKPSSFARVAQAINDRFGTECEPDHVDNHLRTIKNNWATIQKLRIKSGFQWDHNLKMITVLRKEVYDEEIMAHPTHEKYLNKKIEMYNELALVAGKDMATGSFAKQFGDIDLPPTVDVDYSIDLDDSSDNITKGIEDPSRVNRKRSRAPNKDDKFAMLSEQIGEVASALKKMSKNQLDVAELYKEVMEVEGFDEATLVYAFDYLVDNERVAKAFIVKSAKLKKLWLEDFIDKRGNGN
ncbi:uncharacterized protein LOC115753835 [Rhodamnia argentea]|uniref:Uncharacterized protein LOC115753835 n=1 Tax=Rhodamnia argentea TaxID=178133 RepID=A0A8B8QQG4_9MYRT|nr:uncharacterized protein LOC115753835 [Rhodamnia argentea]